MSARPAVGRLSTEQSRELSDQWRALRRAATGVAVLTSPALFIWLHKIQELVYERAIYAPIWRQSVINGAGPRVGESRISQIAGHPYSSPYEDVTLAGK